MNHGSIFRFKTGLLPALIWSLFASSVLVPSASRAQAADKGNSGITYIVPGMEVYLSSGFVGYSKNSQQFDIGPGLLFKPWTTWLQLGGEISYQKVSYQNNTTSNMVFMAGPTVNYDSLFLSIGMAYKKSSGNVPSPDPSDTDPNGIGFYFLVGKHFYLFPGFYLRPSLGVMSAGSTGLVIRPLAVSYSF